VYYINLIYWNILKFIDESRKRKDEKVVKRLWEDLRGYGRIWVFRGTL
jgi:hypothetical protein